VRPAQYSVTDIVTLNEQIDQSLLQERLVATPRSSSGLVALLAGTGCTA
jgi:hypothetical protein